jgi:uncharacterized protein (TIGR03790 family)
MQSEAAAFPDRGAVGLRVTLSEGPAGRYLSHDLGADHARLHARLLLRVDETATGQAQIMGAQTATDQAAWGLELDADAAAVHLLVDHATVISQSLPSGLSWQCLEVKLDTNANTAALWINGVLAAEVTGNFNGLAMRYGWLGALAKTPEASGVCDLDEWHLAGEDIGPVIVPATGPYANDPARWLVLYNTNITSAAVWAETYRQRRGVPFANLLGLALPTSETITPADYANLAQAVNDYLATQAVTDQILGILAGHGVPGYVDDAGALKAVPALLQSARTDLAMLSNPHAGDQHPTRPDAATLNTTRLTARLDGPDRETTEAWLDRADTLIQNGLGDGDAATIFFDPVMSSGVSYYTDRMRQWADSLDRMRTRLPITRSDDGSAYNDVNFNAISSDAFAWLWPATEPDPSDFFLDPPGRRVLSVQLHSDHPTATTLRDAAVANWIASPAKAGYAATVASSRAYSPSEVPYARPLFEALRRGWTLAEAWFVSVHRLRHALYLVGDPLMTVAFPQAGWDLFGPMDRLSQLNEDTPTYALRDETTTLTLNAADRPAEGETALYVLRRRDAHGRSEAGLTLMRLGQYQAAPVDVPHRPTWPDVAGWSPRLERGQLHFDVTWDRPISQCMIDRVDLSGQVDGQSETTLASQPVPRRAESITLPQPYPNGTTRYRWRLISPSGLAIVTPWSRRVQVRDRTTPALQML